MMEENIQGVNGSNGELLETPTVFTFVGEDPFLQSNLSARFFFVPKVGHSVYMKLESKVETIMYRFTIEKIEDDKIHLKLAEKQIEPKEIEEETP